MAGWRTAAAVAVALALAGAARAGAQELEDFAVRDAGSLADLCSTAESSPLFPEARQHCYGFIAGAAALVTIALGLIVGAWFGRARGLIALALLTTVGLLISTGTERWGGEVGNSVYRPDTLNAVADRYDFTAGNATLDLRGIDFTGQQQAITATMKLGQLRVLVPPTVDTTATVRMENGRALILGKEFDGREVDGQSVTDLGTDGTGGGTLNLDLQLDTGNVEVVR